MYFDVKIQVLTPCMEDVEAQRAELEILESIFGDLISFESEDKNTCLEQSSLDYLQLFCINESVLLFRDPPSYELSGPSLSRNDRLELNNALNEAWLENLGSPIIYTWVMVVKNFLEAKEQKSEEEGGRTDEPEEPVQSIPYELDIVPTIHHGEVFTDRKSHFQAHLARVHSKDEVTLVLDRLLENSKISRATHNMYAYRISELRDGREILLHDCFDDGETGASSKMLELLDKMNAINVLVVVSRWYGGIHLGPDRFRHINNLTREIVSAHGLDSRTSSK
ncbi:RWD domain protein [Ancylostoma caninum]|uniref:RWD domain protein n=1 Tax=Ancylostoma caninum TaxID=29170 RepID=A0A368G2C2_ANCCA|nr:RWD domain protein [Ancylostoma caninum]